jgi:hypothetical protein
MPSPFLPQAGQAPVYQFRCPHARARGWAARCCSTCSIGVTGAAAAGRTIRW